jgi:GNAT superfamily N-acetyltransferase
MEDGDRAFVLDTWSRAYQVAPACVELRESAYRLWHRRRMLAILARGTVLVARDSERPNFIYGYGVFERVAGKFVAHWLYVKADYRGRGIARLLLASALASLADGATELVATHRTYVDDKAAELGFTHSKLTDLAPYAGVDEKEKRSCA